MFFLIITYFIRLLETPESSGLDKYTTVHKKKDKVFLISHKRDFLGSWDIRLLWLFWLSFPSTTEIFVSPTGFLIYSVRCVVMFLGLFFDCAVKWFLGLARHCPCGHTLWASLHNTCITVFGTLYEMDAWIASWSEYFDRTLSRLSGLLHKVNIWTSFCGEHVDRYSKLLFEVRSVVCTSFWNSSWSRFSVWLFELSRQMTQWCVLEHCSYMQVLCHVGSVMRIHSKQ